MRTTTMSQMDDITIFDTTLRDGEQSPGASMNLSEKLEIAQALQDLGVDVMEAGFPIASPGDFEAVSEIARHIRGTTVCGLARCRTRGHRLRVGRLETCRTGADSCIPRDQRDSPGIQAEDEL